MTEPDKMVCELDKPLLLVHEEKMSDRGAKLIPLLEKVAQMSQALAADYRGRRGERGP